MYLCFCEMCVSDPVLQTYISFLTKIYNIQSIVHAIQQHNWYWHMHLALNLLHSTPYT